VLIDPQEKGENEATDPDEGHWLCRFRGQWRKPL